MLRRSAGAAGFKRLTDRLKSPQSHFIVAPGAELARSIPQFQVFACKSNSMICTGTNVPQGMGGELNVALGLHRSEASSHHCNLCM